MIKIMIMIMMTRWRRTRTRKMWKTRTIIRKKKGSIRNG